jgi:hypothetical protein
MDGGWVTEVLPNNIHLVSSGHSTVFIISDITSSTSLITSCSELAMGTVLKKLS